MVRKQIMTLMFITLLVFAGAIAFAEDSMQPHPDNTIIPGMDNSTTNRPSITNPGKTVPMLTQSQIQAIEISCMQQYPSDKSGYNSCVKDQRKTECSKKYKANSTDYSSCIK